MPAPTHSSWDRTNLPYGRDLDPARGYKDHRGGAARSLSRTELFDAAAETISTGDAPAPDPGAEYLARLAATRALVTAPVTGRSLLIGLLHSTPYASRGGLETVAAIAVLLAAGWFGRESVTWVFALLLIVIGAMVARQVLRRDQLKPALIALDARACPDCGYDLAGAPSGLPLDTTNSVNVGPRACPECGVPWPLVPPPYGP